MSAKARVLSFCEGEARLPSGLDDCVDATVTTSVAGAIRAATSGSYDCYLAYGGGGPAGAADFWLQVRASDPNTPFVFVSGHPLPASLVPRLRAGYDIFATWPCSAYELMLLVTCLVNSAELRSLRARMEEARAIADDLRERLQEANQRMAAADAAVARAEEHLMRAHALKAFSEAGGAPRFFERYWEDTLAHELERHRELGR